FELIELSKVDISGMDKRIFRTKIIVLCDVQNKLLGYEGAARVFGPQKGADKNEVALLEQCLKRWNDQTIQTLQINMNKIKYGGAASGIAAGLAAYTSAKLVGGIEFFLDQMYFDNLLHQADLVITGEGSIDDQTLEGKGPFGVAKRAKKRNIPVIGMAGQIKVSPQSKLYGYFKELIVINPPGISLEKVIKDTAVNLKRAACRWGNTDKF
ncbi:MAG: glycerate kinase, partial [Chitinophagaceae bacterium]